MSVIKYTYRVRKVSFNSLAEVEVYVRKRFAENKSTSEKVYRNEVLYCTYVKVGDGFKKTNFDEHCNTYLKLWR